jgi:hypothetical protein
MKLIRYTAVLVSFLVGWIGVAVLVRHCMTELFPGDYGDLYVQYGYPSEHHVLTDWLELPGSVLGLPVGCLLAYLTAAVLKREEAR